VTGHQEAIKIAILMAERKAKELREACRHLNRIARKRNRTERDAATYDEMCRRIRASGLTLPTEWRSLCW
jgi:DNA-binding IclR family transcriptional regulator